MAAESARSGAPESRGVAAGNEYDDGERERVIAEAREQDRRAGNLGRDKVSV